MFYLRETKSTKNDLAKIKKCQNKTIAEKFIALYQYEYISRWQYYCASFYINLKKLSS